MATGAMETVKINIEECPDEIDTNRNISDRRTRKISVDHTNIRPNHLDIGGSRRIIRRLGSVGESPCALGGLLSKLDNGHVAQTCSVGVGVSEWQKYFLSEIQALMSEGQCVANIRKSSTGNLNVCSSECSSELKTLSKRNYQRRKSTAVVTSTGDTQCQVKYSPVDNARTKRKSCFAFNIERSKSEHHLHVPDGINMRRLKSSTDVDISKRSTKARRHSAVKAPTFTVARLTSIQRRLYRIYRRRRRKELKCLPTDVTGLDNVNNVNVIGTENDVGGSGLATVDCENNVLVAGATSTDVFEDVVEQRDQCDFETELCEMVLNCLVTEQHEKTQPKQRRSSIQTRSLEISHKLRQRRRARRQREREID